jgi:hypothetical protein
MPRDVKVRICDDINGNGVQDIDELGIENVNLIDAKKENLANTTSVGRDILVSLLEMIVARESTVCQSVMGVHCS